MNEYIISIGSNTNKEENMKECRKLLSLSYSAIIYSEMIETVPYGENYSSVFLNQLAIISSDANENEVKDLLKGIELKLGRKKTDKQRGIVVIDADLLVANGRILKSDDYKRPYMNRLFQDVEKQKLAPIYFETPNLIFRGWKNSDLQSFIDLNANSVVMEYFLKNLTENESIEFYNRIQAEFDEYGYGLYAVELKETGEFIGYTGFHHVTFGSDFTPCIEIGWRLTNSIWNKGYATEGAKSCLDYGFETLHLEKIYSFTSLPNKRSERVMQKIGMQKVKEFDHPLVPIDHPLCRHVLYKIEKNKD